MTNTTTNSASSRRAELAQAARHALAQMRAMLEEGHAALDDMEDMIDAGNVPVDLRAGIEQQRGELELFAELADAYEDRRLSAAARVGFVRLLSLPTSH